MRVEERARQQRHVARHRPAWHRLEDAGSRLRGEVAFTATFFAVGSAVFSYLLLRGRTIPVPLAWLGVGASALLVVALPLQVARFLTGGWLALLWLPMLAFEVPLAGWLIVRGGAVATARVERG